MGLITTQVTVGDGLTDTYIATDLNHSAVTRVRIDIWNNIGFDFPILKDGITSVDVDQTSLASSDPIENLGIYAMNRVAAYNFLLIEAEADIAPYLTFSPTPWEDLQSTSYQIWRPENAVTIRDGQQASYFVDVSINSTEAWMQGRVFEIQVAIRPAYFQYLPENPDPACTTCTTTGATLAFPAILVGVPFISNFTDATPNVGVLVQQEIIANAPAGTPNWPVGYVFYPHDIARDIKVYYAPNIYWQPRRARIFTDDELASFGFLATFAPHDLKPLDDFYMKNISIDRELLMSSSPQYGGYAASISMNVTSGHILTIWGRLSALSKSHKCGCAVGDGRSGTNPRNILSSQLYQCHV
eukprot:TRINITY_DN6149_c0_g2_i6.p1 TRINITY_DN6149_c0_g2~~TRINITY_DN6149_c0_g2_i6.p1  ORF type:complete len:356 (+),score=31.77 TRINITY_DN6149_c0_g2_i6:289-1356(+)